MEEQVIQGWQCKTLHPKLHFIEKKKLRKRDLMEQINTRLGDGQTPHLGMPLLIKDTGLGIFFRVEMGLYYKIWVISKTNESVSKPIFCCLTEIKLYDNKHLPFFIFPVLNPVTLHWKIS